MSIFLTDDDRSFFSVIVPIHKAFKEKKLNAEEVKAKTSKRRSRQEIKDLILTELEKESLSATALYARLGYSDNFSKPLKFA